MASPSAKPASDSGRSRTTLTIDRAFVKEYAPQYAVSDIEDQVLRKDGPKARKNGKMKRKAFLRVGQWKGLAVFSHLEQHSTDDIEFITSIALSKDTPDKFRVSLLTTLDGVGVPLASSLLSAAFPDRFAIMDSRAVGALHRAGHLTTNNPARVHYADYLATLQELAQKCTCSLADLYRALHAWSAAR